VPQPAPGESRRSPWWPADVPSKAAAPQAGPLRAVAAPTRRCLVLPGRPTARRHLVRPSRKFLAIRLEFLRTMSPGHTRRRGRIYRYYVAREAIADGYDSCPVTSVPAADIEGTVLDHVQKLLAAPGLVARDLGGGEARERARDHRARGPGPAPQSGTSCSPPSRRGSCSFWSSGPTFRRTRWR
jgi:hypothetical protein